MTDVRNTGTHFLRTWSSGKKPLHVSCCELLNNLTRPHDFSLESVSAFDEDRGLLDAVLENARNEC